MKLALFANLHLLHVNLVKNVFFSFLFFLFYLKFIVIGHWKFKEGTSLIYHFSTGCALHLYFPSTVAAN